ncbi:(+)-neomenthol dehydrogenase-like [Tripterygium wilfordii]|uniref:(+)-neomenthol dehydrogenase-like n=1 Tax=Tripterygium wilfordii TaxID=458696 RepID=UPI0018F81F2E|nr:(+)-neomenthol dehydrogenase-like [Tripterygium wilfordii]XP_038687244.1 (+)-neomenthol dehydrogenase-like [Tripterygium wilfordii]XP_038687245.1 (+)-neomenthol dehydrogenase-like [Tripterygium wilfordii]
MAGSTKRYAVVTGANRGIGLGVVKRLASEGIIVVLTARDEKKGLEAVEKLKEFGHIVFHQLDVTDPASVSSLTDFIKSQFGKLDILVNNAASGGIKLLGDPPKSRVPDEVEVNNAATSGDALPSDVPKNAISEDIPEISQIDWTQILETYDLAGDCIETNYYGPKRMIEALIPLLLLSDLPRIVNVSSIGGKLGYITNKRALELLSDVETLTEDRVEDVLREFRKDFKDGLLEINCWPCKPSSYKISKAALNAYTRIMAKKYPTFCVNCVCPGPVKTETSFHSGTRTPEEGAEGLVKLALLPKGGPSGLFFTEKGVSTF